MGWGQAGQRPADALDLSPAARRADTFVVDAKVALGEADVVVLVLGAPGARQWRLLLVDSRIQALQASAQLLLPRGREPAPSAPAGRVPSLRAPSSRVRRRRRHLRGSCYCVTEGGEERDQISPLSQWPASLLGPQGNRVRVQRFSLDIATPRHIFGLHILQCRDIQRRANIG
jgi:hypothetical protein